MNINIKKNFCPKTKNEKNKKNFGKNMEMTQIHLKADPMIQISHSQFPWMLLCVVIEFTYIQKLTSFFLEPASSISDCHFRFCCFWSDWLCFWGHWIDFFPFVFLKVVHKAYKWVFKNTKQALTICQFLKQSQFFEIMQIFRNYAYEWAFYWRSQFSCTFAQEWGFS